MDFLFLISTFAAEQPVWGSKGASGPQGEGGGEDEKEVLPRGAQEDQLPDEKDEQGGGKQPSTCFSTCTASASTCLFSTTCPSNSTSFTCCHSHTCTPRLSSPPEGSATGEILSKVNWHQCKCSRIRYWRGSEASTSRWRRRKASVWPEPSPNQWKRWEVATIYILWAMRFVNCQIVEPEVEETFSGREISFKVKKTMMGRIGKKS